MAGSGRPRWAVGVFMALIAGICMRCPASVAAEPDVLPSDGRGAEAVGDSAGTLIRDIMAAEPDSFGRFLADADQYGIQVIYTRIDRDARNQPSFRQYSWGVDRQRYFNPASLVKLPVSLVALERVRRLGIPGLTIDTPMTIRRGPGCRTWHTRREPAVPLSLHVRRMLLVSDNMAYSRVFEFLGQDYLNERLHELGFTDVVICRRFCPGSWQQNRTANPVDFLGRKGAKVYSMPIRVSRHEWLNPLAGDRGAGGGSGGARNVAVSEHANYLSLQSINDMLRYVMFPNSCPEGSRFDLTEADLRLLRRQLALYPRESGLAEYSVGTDYRDNHKKYFIYGDMPQGTPMITNENLRIFNVVGRYDGYIADVAYVVDRDKGVEFLLTAVIDSSRGAATGDHAGRYRTDGFPFLARLGRAVYRYECARPRDHRADLGALFEDLR